MKNGLLFITLLAVIHVHAQNNSKVMATSNEQDLTCKLTSKELQERKQTVLAELRTKILLKTELENGFQYSFDGTDKMIDQLSLFIKTERQCCDFFDYHLVVAGNGKRIEMKITGPEGVKDFIKSELGL